MALSNRFYFFVDRLLEELDLLYGITEHILDLVLASLSVFFKL